MESWRSPIFHFPYPHPNRKHNMNLQGKHIILGITGGIAAYKAPMLVRLLVKAGAEVRCAATDHALQFVTELTLETVSQNKVYHDLFAIGNDHTTEHIALKDWADLAIVAPATANIIGKMACGIADDALSTLLLSMRQPIYICPSMNTQMYESPILQRNLQTLKSIGVHIIEPKSGFLACGTNGAGRMPEPEEIADLVCNADDEQSLDYAGRRILLTAGPTYEKIDAVRFIGNYSTGKMGFALAEELADRGAEVVLVAGPTHLGTHNPRIRRIDVESAREMHAAATEAYPECHAAILTAAVADFRPDHQADHKIKKSSADQDMTLHLIQNPDILASLGRDKRDDQRLVGFALETTDGIDYAVDKIRRKNLDFIVLNSLQNPGAGFGHDTNLVTIIDRDGTQHPGVLKTKRQVAADIADHLLSLL